MSGNGTTKKVGGVFKVLGGGTPSTTNPDFWIGPIPWATSADLDDDLGITPRKAISRKAIEASATNLVPAGSVVVATRVGLGKVGIAPADICFSQDCQGLILDPETCDSKFAAFQLKLRVQIFKHISRGTTIAGVTKKQLLDVDFDLPPIKQQRRIVAEIEKQFTRLGAGVAALRRVQANLKRYRAAVLKAACEGRLVPTEAELQGKLKTKNSKFETGAELLARILTERHQNWLGRGQYKEPAAPDTANLSPLPNGWTWATIEQIAAAIVDCPHSTPKWTKEGRICVRTTEFRPGLLDLTEVRFVSEESYRERIARLEPKPNDILYSREGGILGLACRIPDGVSLCLGQRMMLIRPSAEMRSRFVMDWLNSPEILVRVKALTSGSASPHLNVGDIREFPVPPPAEQARIVAEVERRLSVVEELESVVSANLQRATRLRQSIFQKAFTGGFIASD